MTFLYPTHANCVCNLATVGLGSSSIYECFTNAFVMERASVSTMPFGIDDPSKKPSKGSDISEVVVDIYNHGKTGTLRKTSHVPLAAPVIATNYELKNDDRYIPCFFDIHNVLHVAS